MAVQKKFALGRGLDALISTEEVKTSGSSSINEIELSKIAVNPNQPRREFDPVALQELSDSISEIGIIPSKKMECKHGRKTERYPGRLRCWPRWHPSGRWA